MAHPAAPPHATTALVLTGGGARAAYQVGALQAIAALRAACGERHGPSPFAILTGTSAGAINAAALASGADQFDHSVRRIARVWASFHAQQVYHADYLNVLRRGAHWLTLLSLGWALTRWHHMHPHSLLNNAPLAQLLEQLVPLARVPHLIHAGYLRALAVTASSYSSGQHVAFFDAGDAQQPWAHTLRKSVRGPITHAHLLASSAIPLVFPAAPLAIDGHTEFFGDGSMRETSPLAPAIHLGAERLLVVGTSRAYAAPPPCAVGTQQPYPALSLVAGHALSNIFLDALAVDINHVQHINHVLSLLTPEQRGQVPLRPLQLLVLQPSQSLDELAARHVCELPRTIRALLNTLGMHVDRPDGGNGALASYLLFEHGYTRALMALGRADTLARRAEVCAFFGWHDRGNPVRLPSY
ncbi:MAG: patatin-like phospholipase family protein [Proteobacteria bacterium]|nr:patatin-like phospholipase family protein [Pseudomonadota bacterium]